jgi:hypothetical protein
MQVIVVADTYPVTGLEALTPWTSKLTAASAAAMAVVTSAASVLRDPLQLIPARYQCRRRPSGYNIRQQPSQA